MVLMRSAVLMGILVSQMVLVPVMAATCSDPYTVQPPSTIPQLTGRIAYHSSDSQGNSQLWIYNFTTNVDQQVSQNWDVTQTLNPHFSTDGKWITFAGVQSGKFDVFAWRIGTAQPINLTAGMNAARSEDSKFSVDGKSIIFKQDGNIRRMLLGDDANGNLVPLQVIPVTTGGRVDGSYNESSEPYLSPDNKFAFYFRGVDVPSHIFRMNLTTLQQQQITVSAGQTQYYPITRSTDGVLFYAGHNSAAAQLDSIYMQNPNLINAQAIKLGLNDPNSDNSDAFPLIDSSVSNKTLITFSKDSFTAACASLPYAIYLGDYSNGHVWSLPALHGVNSTDDLLGSNYTSTQPS